jgi:hypothetical protein
LAGGETIESDKLETHEVISTEVRRRLPRILQFLR